MKKLLLFVVCVLVYFVPLCAEGAEGPVRLGVMRFLSRTDGVSPQQAEAVGDIFTRMLTNSRTIAVIERDQLDAIAAEHKLGLSGVLDARSAVEVGKIVGCQYMLMGSVTNLARKASGVNIWIVGTSNQEASATVDVRVVNVETSEVVLSLSETGTSSQSGSSFSFYGITTTENELSGMEGRAIAATASSLAFKIRENLTGEYAQVVNAAGKDVTLSVGATSGVSKGGLYRIYTDGEEILNADGSVLGRKTNTIAIVKVVDAHNDFSVANVAKNGGNVALIQKGDKVSPISPAEAQDLAKRKAFAKDRPKRRLGEAEILNVDERLSSISQETKTSGMATASAFSEASAPLHDAPAERLISSPAGKGVTPPGRPLENSSTDPGKVIATYGLPSGDANTRRIAHINAGKLSNKQQAYDKYVELAGSYEGDYLAAYRAGLIARDMGRQDDAVSWFDKALSINPNYEPAKDAKESPAPKKKKR